MIAYSILLDFARYLRRNWPQIKAFLQKKHVYIPLSVFFGLLFGWLLLLNFYLADTERLSNSFQVAKENTQNIYEQYRELPHLAAAFSQDEMKDFEKEAHNFTHNFEQEIDPPVRFFVSHALNDFPDKEQELAILENDDPSELKNVLRDTTLFHIEALATIESVLAFSAEDENPADFFNRAKDSFNDINKNGLDNNSLNNIERILNKLHSESQHYERTQNKQRWEQQLKDLKVELKKAFAEIWRKTYTKNTEQLSELVSDYERMQFLFERL